MVVNSNDSARTACDRPVQRLCLKTFHVELDERGNAVLGDQRIQRRDLDVGGLVPALGFPARRAARGLNERRRYRRHRRVVGIDQHARPARLAPHRHRFDRDTDLLRP